MYETYESLIEIAPVRMGEACDSMTEEQLHDADNTLSHLMQAAAWRRGYICSRRNGDDHDKAVRRANRDLAAVRKVIGYSYPDSAAINV
jgi:hypothetical protein